MFLLSPCGRLDSIQWLSRNGESEEMDKASPTKEKKGKGLTFKNPMQIEE